MKQSSTTPRPYQRVSLRFYLIANHFSHCLERFYRSSFDLNVNEWRVLSSLAYAGPMAAKDVAMRNVMDRVLVTRTVQQLCKEGLISREEDEVDRRRVVLQLTAAGRRVHTTVVKTAHRIEMRLLEEITDAQLATVNEVLAKMESKCDEIFDVNHSVDDFV